MKLTDHFTLEEFVASTTATTLGLLNEPTFKALAALRVTASGMESVRSLLGHPIHISSGYRSPALNTAVGGGSNSQHMRGEACDFVCPAYGSPYDIARAIEASTIMFDQLIYEGTWVHISFSDTPRRSVLTASFVDGRPTYKKGIVT